MRNSLLVYVMFLIGLGLLVYYPMSVASQASISVDIVDEDFWINYYRKAISDNIMSIISDIESYPGFKDHLSGYTYVLDPDPFDKVLLNDIQVGVSYDSTEPDPTVYGILFLHVYTKDGKYAGTVNIYLTPSLKIDHIEYYINEKIYGLSGVMR